MFSSQKNANRKSLKSQSNKFTHLLNNFMKAKVEEIPIDNLSTRDDIVAVMGPTGTGKSTFIEIATGVEGKAGHTLQSCTDKLCVIKLSLPGIIDSDICFVDTPGFDDTRFSDTEIFTMISNWLNDTYNRHIQLAGLLYFHRISDNRMAGTPLKNLRMFEQLCGEKFSRIVLTTTMWDEVEKELGEKREGQLRDEYWKSMIARGSSVRRFEHDRKSAFNVLAPILEEVNKKNALLLQTEMNELGYRLNQTSAGKRLYLELDELVKNQQRCLERIRRELKEEIHDQEYIETLMEDYKKISEQLARANDGLKKMKISVGDRIQGVIKSVDWLKIFSIFSFKRKKTPSTSGVEEDDSEDDEEPRETKGYTEQEKGKGVERGDGPGVPYRVPYSLVTPQVDERELTRGRAPPQEQRIEATSAPHRGKGEREELTRQYEGQRKQDLPPPREQDSALLREKEKETELVRQREKERERAQQRETAEREAKEKEFLRQQEWEWEWAKREARDKEEAARLAERTEKEAWTRDAARQRERELNRQKDQEGTREMVRRREMESYPKEESSRRDSRIQQWPSGGPPSQDISPAERRAKPRVADRASADVARQLDLSQGERQSGIIDEEQEEREMARAERKRELARQNFEQAQQEQWARQQLAQQQELARQHELTRQQELARQQQELVRQQQELTKQQQDFARQQEIVRQKEFRQQELARQQQEFARQQQEQARQTEFARQQEFIRQQEIAQSQMAQAEYARRKGERARADDWSRQGSYRGEEERTKADRGDEWPGRGPSMWQDDVDRGTAERARGKAERERAKVEREAGQEKARAEREMARQHVRPYRQMG